MAKRRDRRAGLGTERRSNRVEASSSDDSAASRGNRDRKFTTVFSLIFIISTAMAVIVYRALYVSRTPTDPTLPYAYRRRLVKTDINYGEILNENTKVSENISRRHFTNPVLAYITPWNPRGYELAKKFKSKLTHISPVWYELKSQGTKLVLEGRHNADTGWISELRKEGNSLVLPRVVLEANPMDLLIKKKQRNKAIDLLVTECREMDYDGIVLESWSRWAAYGVLHDPDMRNMALQFIEQLGQAMHSVSSERKSSENLQFVYVIGPPRSQNIQEHDFGPEDLRHLSDAVDGYSLMTYDFSGPTNPGPNAPLKWIHSTLQLLQGIDTGGSQSLAQKIFVGMNFYGNDFVLSGGLGGGPILGREYLSLLEKHKPKLQWEKNSAEHFFLYLDDERTKHVVFYPSLMSFAMRIEEARSWGAGISIWEIGQGLDYFFDIL